MVPVSAGELLDKLSILRIKAARLTNPAKLEHVHKERAHLENLAGTLDWTDELKDTFNALVRANARLWDLEDSVRRHIGAGIRGDDYIDTARQITTGNDERAKLKQTINRLTGSELEEAKSHAGL